MSRWGRRHVIGLRPERFRKFLVLSLLSLSLPVHFDAIFKIRELSKYPAVNAQSAPPLSAIAGCLEVFKDFLNKNGDFIMNRNGLKNEDLRLGK